MSVSPCVCWFHGPMRWAVIFAALFVLIAADVQHQGILAQQDAALTQTLHSWAAESSLLTAACSVTCLGDKYWLTVLTLGLAAGLAQRRQYRLLVVWCVLMLLVGVLVSQLKDLYSRPRPESASLLSGSFPSGHTLGATAAYGFWAWLSYRQGGKTWLGFALLLLPLAVACSRLLLGEHYPTDVLAGLCLGGTLAAGAVAACRMWGVSTISRDEVTPSAVP